MVFFCYSNKHDEGVSKMYDKTKEFVGTMALVFSCGVALSLGFKVGLAIWTMF